MGGKKESMCLTVCSLNKFCVLRRQHDFQQRGQVDNSQTQYGISRTDTGRLRIPQMICHGLFDPNMQSIQEEE